MALTIQSNIAAAIAHRSSQAADGAISRTLDRLSTGKISPSVRYDVAGSALASRIRGEIVSWKTALNNATLGVSVLQTAEGAYQRTEDMMIRMRSLASQSQSQNLSNTERGMLDTEFQQLKLEITRLAKSTSFSGNDLFATGSLAYGTATNYAGITGGDADVGDFNGDGILDMISIGGGAGDVSIAYGRSDGTFGSWSTLVAGSLGVRVGVGDFNGDGKADFAVRTSGTVFLYTLSNTGTASLITSVTVTNARDIAIADFNGDGFSDFVVGTTTTNITVALSNGAGGYSTTNYTSGITNGEIITGDVNNDGVADFVIRGTTQVQTVLNTGRGSMSLGTTSAIGVSMQEHLLRDMNNDGWMDLVIADSTGVRIQINDGVGNWTNGALYTMTGTANTGVLAGDFNGDGFMDIVTQNSNGTVIFRQGNGTLSFDAQQTLAATGNQLLTADFNRDGRLDIISQTTTGARIILNQSVMGQQGSFTLGPANGTNNSISYRLGSIRLDSLDTDLEFSRISTLGNAKNAEAALLRGLNVLRLFRSSAAATANRLENAQDNLATILESQESARSSLEDLNVATELAQLVALQITRDAGISMLTQANQSNKVLLSLFAFKS